MKKYLRYGVAILITVLTLMIARRLAPVHSVEIKETIGSITVEHSTIAKTVDGQPDVISVKITNPDSTFLFVNLFWAEADGRISSRPDLSAF